MKRALVSFALVLAAAGLAGCRSGADKPREAAPEPEAPALARVGRRVLTVAELQADVDKLPLERRVELTTPAEQRAFVQKAVDQEILAAEAERLGYDKAPEVLAAAKRAMVNKLLRERIGNGPRPEEVSDANVRRYYDEHLAEFGPPERVKVAVIIVKDPDKARAAHAEATASIASAKRERDDAFAAFRGLVEKYTEEEGARDVTLSIGLNGSPYPEAVADAARALAEVGAVSPIVTTPVGHFIVQLKERLPAAPLPFERVKDRVTRALSDDLRDSKTKAFAAELARQHGARVFTERFPDVRFEPHPLMMPPSGHPAQRSASLTTVH